MPERSTNLPGGRTAPLPTSAITWLDVIRAISAQLVVLGHLGLLHAFEKGPFWLPPLASLAVIMFYLLSGFLITRTLCLRFRDPGYDFGRFFIDRFCRIYPAYIAALLLVALIDYPHRLYFPENYHSFLSGLGELSYTLPNFLATAFMIFKAPLLGSIVGHENLMIFGSASQFWSLPPEWWLYLTVGYLALTFKHGAFGLKNYLAIAIFAYIPFFFLFQGNPVTGEGMAAVWLMGGCTSLVYDACRVDMTKPHVRRFIIFGALLLVMTTVFRYQIAANPYDALGAFNLAGLFLVTIWLAQHPLGSILTGKAVRVSARFLASYAYSLYLTHYSLIGFLNNFELSPIVSWTVCNLFAAAFACLFEMPHHQWARKLHYWRQLKAVRPGGHD